MTRNRRLEGAALAFFVCASSSAFAQPSFEPMPLELVQLRDDLYVLRNDQSGNITVLVTDEGVLLIDDKFDFDYENIVAMVASITEQPIEYVINTHHHPDHAGSNAQMQAADAVIVASENARLMMVEGDQAGLPDVTLDDYLRIFIGGAPVDVHYFGRGHTDGDVVVHLPEHDVVVMGDLFAGPGVQLIHYAAGASARVWPRTLDRALKLPFETVIPGHSPVTNRSALEAYRDETQRVQEMVLEMNRQERTRDEIAAVLQSEFNWPEIFLQYALDGIIVEMQ